ncbi:MAG: hypothetical protein ACBR21_30250 [Microcoleus sp.]
MENINSRNAVKQMERNTWHLKTGSKSAAARQNGKKGGRPKKNISVNS